jgi:methyl-accepting chemotaxis protein
MSIELIQAFSQVGIGAATLFVLYNYMRSQDNLIRKILEALSQVTALSAKTTQESANSMAVAQQAMQQSGELLDRVKELTDNVEKWAQEMRVYNETAATRTRQINDILEKVNSTNAMLITLIKGNASIGAK